MGSLRFLQSFKNCLSNSIKFIHIYTDCIYIYTLVIQVIHLERCPQSGLQVCTPKAEPVGPPPTQEPHETHEVGPPGVAAAAAPAAAAAVAVRLLTRGVDPLEVLCSQGSVWWGCVADARIVVVVAVGVGGVAGRVLALSGREGRDNRGSERHFSN